PHVLAKDRLRTWSLTFGREHDAEFRRQMPVDAVNKTYATIFAAYAPNTQSTYAAGLLRFHQYCDKHSIPESARMPASYFLIAAFIAEHVGTISGSAIKGWLSGVKAWHDLNGADWNGETRWVELARRTANKEGNAFKRDQCGPVSMQHMVCLRATLDLDDSFDAAVWAVAAAAFWGCRRLGELTVPSPDTFDPKYHVGFSVQERIVKANTADAAICFHIPWTKSTRERGADVTLTARNDELCPRKALANHRRVNTFVPDHAPLFAFMREDSSWSGVSKTWFLTCCTNIWDKADLLRVFGHSFRIGGSTELLLAGVPCEVVAAVGGWTSLAFLLYWRKIQHIVPMAVGKAYDEKRLAEVAKAMEEFRATNGIIIHTEDNI
ncbi:hypothetical protein B0H12DRAFT_1035115, partial [Mycena haematopus]